MFYRPTDFVKFRKLTVYHYDHIIEYFFKGQWNTKHTHIIMFLLQFSMLRDIDSRFLSKLYLYCSICSQFFVFKDNFELLATLAKGDYSLPLTQKGVV